MSIEEKLDLIPQILGVVRELSDRLRLLEGEKGDVEAIKALGPLNKDDAATVLGWHSHTVLRKAREGELKCLPPRGQVVEFDPVYVQRRSGLEAAVFLMLIRKRRGLRVLEGVAS